MIRNKITCQDCGIEVSVSNFTKHLNSKTCLRNQENNNSSKQTLKLDESWKAESGKYACPNCSLEYSKNGILSHIWRTHGDGIGFTANNDNFKSGTRTAWNKGLTKETNEIVKKIGESYSEGVKSGRIIPYILGKNHSKETRLKIQKYAFSRENPCGKKVYEYTMVSGEKIKMDSSWEVKIAKSLDAAEIEWIRPKPLKWIDAEGFSHNYYSDFYIPSWDVYLEPKSDWVQKIQNEKQPGKWEYLNSVYDNIFILKEHQLDVESIKSAIGIK